MNNHSMKRALTGVVAGAAFFIAAAGLTQAQTLMPSTSAMPSSSSSSATAAPFSGTFTRNLTIGSAGDDVQALQVFLNNQGFQVASSGPGSPGNETTYFGLLTQTALANWQTSQNITPAAGFFGPITRAAVNSMIGPTNGNGGGTTTPSATSSASPASRPSGTTSNNSNAFPY